ncbi:ribbon-helix-helix protein, CopG family [Amycolatopsis anabasis]|uniref:ribbon-helix-helix protein, CopG family n=1 Tax=Amycolatopsis anabasis TaxID=1840409 RepID=UPI00131B2DB3|nr:ribbon-helix-helix protein, CopG family [Amycolatopsis anabasis]
MTTFTVRLNSEAEAKLSALLEEGGRSRNAVIHDAIDLAWQHHRLEQVRIESAALLHDEEDRAEIGAARSAMGAGDAW